MKLSAKALRYGDDISTDLIIAGKYTKTLDKNELASHAMEDLDSGFTDKVRGGAFVVAGSNFGCGSSREQAPVALKEAGVLGIAAKSFARIFYRNAINIGLPLLECDTSSISDGDVLEYEVGSEKLINKTTGEEIAVAPLPSIMIDILLSGGIINYYRKK
ncbi:MAG: 3-isopropylmalate dehydratase small subunit [Firmicutes bacterium]|nr:3-isopropylmalate dehydratase small subunit [Bacillota bacterium]NSW92150.1 3-isopropylmalate dehydratase small subunit [Bacillota bacterium]